MEFIETNELFLSKTNTWENKDFISSCLKKKNFHNLFSLFENNTEIREEDVFEVIKYCVENNIKEVLSEKIPKGFSSNIILIMKMFSIRWEYGKLLDLFLTLNKKETKYILTVFLSAKNLFLSSKEDEIIEKEVFNSIFIIRSLSALIDSFYLKTFFPFEEITELNNILKKEIEQEKNLLSLKGALLCFMHLK